MFQTSESVYQSSSILFRVCPDGYHARRAGAACGNCNFASDAISNDFPIRIPWRLLSYNQDGCNVFQSTQVGKTKALGRPRDNLHSAGAVKSGWFRGGRRITLAGGGGRH
jgi:hypothetical protein